jgi:hypothetical protein
LILEITWSQPGMILVGYRAEELKNSGMVIAWPMPTFGPSRPYISPGAIDRFTWSTARCVANW